MSRAGTCGTECGIAVAASALAITKDAVDELRAQLDPETTQRIIAFFSVEHDAQDLIQHLSAAFPGVPVSGCSTAGAITPSGMTEGGLLAIAFPKAGFKIHSELIANIGEGGVERATEAVRRLKTESSWDKSQPRKENIFALMLIDGLSNTEETVVAAIHWAIDDIPLVGGSAGDGLNFESTAIIHDGQVFERAAVLMLIESDFEFRVFKTQNFEPTSIKLVVTSADTENRIVYELNAEPAAKEYAAAIGLAPGALGPFSFASHPLVVKVGGDYYCRSIRNVNEDGSLSFFCAIDEGLVFTVANPRDMLSSTETVLQDLDESLGGIDMVLGFDCILRRLDAETRQIRHKLDELYRRHNVVGFHTYGEQFNAMHLNQTLTGIAFGRHMIGEA